MRDLLDKRLVIVTGKGGVGKSTVALALGLAAAERGKRTIVCEVSAQEGLSRVFHRAEVGFHEVEMADNLWAISIDPDESMREYVLLQLKVKAMRDLLFRSRIFNYLAAATPGLRELVTIGKIWELAQPNRKVKKRARVRPGDRRRARRPGTASASSRRRARSPTIARVGPIRQQAETLDAFLTDHERTGVAIVALPEEMPVNESGVAGAALTDEVGTSVDRVYHERPLPGALRRRARCETHRARRARTPTARVRAACRAALSQCRRAGGQREQLARLAELVDGPGAARCRSSSSRSSRSSRSASWRRRSADGRRRRAARGQAGLHLRRLRRRRQDDDVGRDRRRDGGAGQEGRRADDRPGQATRRLARACPSWATRSARSTRRCSTEAGIDPGDGELWAMMLDAKATFDEVVRRHAPDEETRERILDNRIYQQLSGALAGSQEYMAMEKLFEIWAEDRYDLLVLDTPPTRNALDFLEAPKRLTQFIEGRSLQVFLRPTGFATQGHRRRHVDGVLGPASGSPASTCSRTCRSSSRPSAAWSAASRSARSG